MKTVKFLFIFLLVGILTHSCIKKEDPVYGPVISGDIRMGALLSLTGAGSSTGLGSQASLELARQDILAYLNRLRINKQVKIEIADTKTDTAEALKQLKLMYDKGLRLILGPYTSAELSALKNFADTHDMLIVSPSSVAVSLAIPNDNVFRFVSNDAIQGAAMKTMLVEDSVKVIVPLVRDDVWGRDLLASTRSGYEASGGKVHPPLFYSPDVTDFSAFLEQLDGHVADELGSYGPDEVAVYLLSLGEGSNFLGKAGNFPNLGNVAWYGNSAFAQNALVLADTTAASFAWRHGFPCPVYGLDDAARDKWQPLVSRVQGLTGQVPDVYAITAYDACWVAVLAYLRTGPAPSVAFLKSVFTSEAGNFFGASGNTALDVNGDRATGNYDFWAVKNNNGGYAWKTVAKYNSVTGKLTRVAK